MKTDLTAPPTPPPSNYVLWMFRIWKALVIWRAKHICTLVKCPSSVYQKTLYWDTDTWLIIKWYFFPHFPWSLIDRVNIGPSFQKVVLVFPAQLLTVFFSHTHIPLWLKKMLWSTSLSLVLFSLETSQIELLYQDGNLTLLGIPLSPDQIENL